MIQITERAKQKFIEACDAEGRSGHGLRVVVEGGGTSQPRIALDFVAPGQGQPDDTIVDLGEIKVHADPASVKWLDEAKIDFVETLTESGFKVDAPNAGTKPPSGPVAIAVQEVLDEQINPAVASHGGHVSLIAIEEETAYLKFGGGCQGCGMINVTLKQGVERMIFESVPQIKKVLDVTDHAAGTNPYYQPSK